ncbi:MAG: PKD domain-containing protein, partial [Flavobacteriales bacterium]|nr:PKD domain-containing protein [Flavobacteriales bacterium]
MKRQLRSLLLSSTVLMGTLAFAQPLPPYQVVVQGTVLGCTPNSFVNVVTATNTQPEMDIDVPIGPSCTFYVMLTMETPTGAFVITTPCNGAIQTVTAEYVVNALDSNYVTVLINCAGIGPDCNGTVGGTAWPGTICDDGNPATVNDNWSADCLCTGDSIPNILDCLGILNGPNLPGTSCLDPMTGVSGTWGLDCICAGDTTSGECYSGFFVMQAYQWVDSAANPNGGGGEPIPNELWIWNLSSGGTGSLQYTWDFGDGTTSTDPFPTHTYASGSAYLLCLTIADGAGCTDT